MPAWDNLCLEAQIRIAAFLPDGVPVVGAVALGPAAAQSGSDRGERAGHTDVDAPALPVT